MRGVLALVLAFVVCLTLSCGEDQPVVVVELQTDLVPGVEFDRVRTELSTGVPTVDTAVLSRVAELAVAEGDGFSRAVRVAELDSTAVGSYFLRVQAILGRAIVAERLLAIEIVGNAAFTVVLTRECRGARCPRAADPASAVSCVGGLCVEPACVTGREVECPPRQCGSDADCVSTVACAMGECIDGLCLLRADDTACAETERCHPELGCIDTGMCVPLAEICNETDDDCDRLIDEDFDLSSDLDNCGVCGGRCGGENATAECTGGTCTIACAEGYRDCNASELDGCEVDLTQPETCGACDGSCSGATPYCEGGACTAGCTGGLLLCGGSCVDTGSDRRHCGGCDADCPTGPNASASCEAGSCALICSANYADCNGVATDGCETSLLSLASCGSCGTACARTNAIPTCTAGSAGSEEEPQCRIQTCSPGFDNCDGEERNGCETSLTSVANCGSCGTLCSLPDAIAECVGAVGMTPTCRIQTCASGFANCDTNHANGCEVRTTSDLRNCGGCGVACGASEVCESGGCVCGMSRGVTGGGPACVSPDRCCPGDRCRPMTSACAVK